jgi:serine/threonine-protein kinase
LRNLGAVECELGRSLLDLGAALALFSTANGTHDDLSLCAHQLAYETERIRTAMDDPALALAEAATSAKFADADSIAEQIESSIKNRDTSPIAFWFRKLGPVIGPLVERACDQAVRRTPPPRKKPSAAPASSVPMVAGYELIRTLGEGGMGTVWLVRRPGGARCFVMKLPHKDALAKANDMERQAILSSFEEEARVLTSLYHPNVASIIDSGIHENLPFLILEYLIGADMRNYVRAKLLTLQELKPIVTEACAGLASLHERGLVHRDIKPANIWLRLPLFENTTFDPQLHRDPTKTPVLATVVIDFGLVRAFNIETGGRVVAGTAGYIAPEQVFDPIDLDGRADTYSMAATVYHAMTGRSFFDDIADEAQRYLAHAGREPFDAPERAQGLPPALVDLLRRATCKDPTRRLDILDFARQFSAI